MAQPSLRKLDIPVLQPMWCSSSFLPLTGSMTAALPQNSVTLSMIIRCSTFSNLLCSRHQAAGTCGLQLACEHALELLQIVNKDCIYLTIKNSSNI